MRTLDRREVGAAAVVSCAVAVALSWPLAISLSTKIPHTLDDPVFKAWEVGWVGHALLHQPLDLFQANAFWPLDNSLAFSDAMVGNAPIAALGSGTVATLVHYNLLFLLAYALAALAVYLLGRELGLPPAGAAVAAAAFAWAPWRGAHASHLHVIASGGIPLALFLLVRGYRRASGALVAGGWIAATWQLTLGFTLGLQLAYLLAIIVSVGAIVAVRRGWRPSRGVLVGTAAGATAFALTGLLQSRPYVAVADAYPQARRTTFEVSSLSPVPAGFLATHPDNLVWGDATARFRARLRAPAEQALFPGVAILTLAAAGLASPVIGRRVRVGLGAGVVVTLGFALGLHDSLGALGEFLPYRLLYELAPGWAGIRTPGRIYTLTSLALALLAGAGAAWLVSRMRCRSAAAAALAAALVAAILLEGWTRIDYPRVPIAPAGQLSLPGPQLHLPTEAQRDALFLVWSASGFAPLANGYVGFRIPSLERMRREAESFPDARSTAYLRRRGIRVVVLHPDLATGTPWQEAERRPIAGLGLHVEHRDGVVVYRLLPSRGT